jgi:hypothetical protein
LFQYLLVGEFMSHTRLDARRVHLIIVRSRNKFRMTF